MQMISPYKRAPSTPLRGTIIKKLKTSDVKPGITRTGGFYGRYNPLMPGEKKFLDITTDQPVPLTAAIPTDGQLNLIPQGVTESTRVGRKCTIKSIQMRGVFTFSPAASTFACTAVDVWVVLDKQCNGAAAAASDVIVGTVLPVAHHNLANSSRFHVLHKFKLVFNGGAGVSGAYTPVVKKVEWYKKVNIPIDFSSTTGAITEIRSNNLFLLFGANNAASLTNSVLRTRLRFIDA